MINNSKTECCTAGADAASANPDDDCGDGGETGAGRVHLLFTPNIIV